MTEVLMWHSKKPRRLRLRGFSIPFWVGGLIPRLATSSCVLEKQIVNTDGIKELLPELKRIGNNLNQIAKRCNEGGMLPSEAEVRKHGEELNKVWQSLRRYLQRRA